LVLPRVRVERHDHGDAFRARALQRVYHDQLLHDPLVDRRGEALQNERVRATHRFLVPDLYLAVAVAVQRLRGDRLIEVFGDLLGEFDMRTAGEEHQVLLRRAGFRAHSGDSPSISVSCCAASAFSAASAAGVPGLRLTTQPSMLRCGAPETASAPGGTSRRITVPAPL